MRELIVIVALLAGVILTEAREQDVSQVVWQIDNLTGIGGNRTARLGAPRVVESESGRAVEFDGLKDGLLVDDLPLAGAREFTVEVIFRPDAGGPAEQRFFHLQETGSEDRILLETRVTPDNRWFLDTYIQSGAARRTLYAENFKHPVGQWYQAALVFDGREMRHYVNGNLELAGELNFTPLSQGQTSVGVRHNQVFWFKGAMRLARFSRRALVPKEFLQP